MEMSPRTHLPSWENGNREVQEGSRVSWQGSAASQSAGLAEEVPPSLPSPSLTRQNDGAVEVTEPEKLSAVVISVLVRAELGCVVG